MIFLKLPTIYVEKEKMLPVFAAIYKALISVFLGREQEKKSPRFRTLRFQKMAVFRFVRMVQRLLEVFGNHL